MLRQDGHRSGRLTRLDRFTVATAISTHLSLHLQCFKDQTTMTTHATISANTGIFPPAGFGRSHRLLLGYLCLLPLPFLLTFALPMADKGIYAAALTAINTLAMMAFYLQFPLGSRLKRIPLFANIDWNIAQHKKTGQWIGISILLHPILILAPRFMVSFRDGMHSLMTVLTAPQMLTGIIAWVCMMLWILAAVFKQQLKLGYEAWRFTHMLGFVVIAILATLHVMSVGSHGQFHEAYNLVWWTLCYLSVLMVLYNYIVKPLILRSHPFRLVDVNQVSRTDWQVTIEKSDSSDFNFQPGQFVWLNTSKRSGGVNEHPFSIASCPADLPRISFIIRNLGDYTSRLDTLRIGQPVYVDGPYGSLSLEESSRSEAILLIAGGAGIGPMLSLLRGLARTHDPRPIRLIYGNNDLDQMVLQEEIRALEQSMPDFKQQLVCITATDQDGIYQGVIDQTCIEQVMQQQNPGDWSVYLCGPQAMITAINKSLKLLNISPANIHYEQLSF